MTRILVADDNQMIRIMLCATLEDDGYETESAADAETAFDIFSALRPISRLLVTRQSLTGST